MRMIMLTEIKTVASASFEKPPHHRRQRGLHRDACDSGAMLGHAPRSTSACWMRACVGTGAAVRCCRRNQEQIVCSER